VRNTQDTTYKCCGKNAEVLNVIAGGTYSCHWDLKGSNYHKRNRLLKLYILHAIKCTDVQFNVKLFIVLITNFKHPQRW